MAAMGTAEATDFCSSYSNTCSAFLDGIACPALQHTNVGCEIPGNYFTFIYQCNCAGAVDGSLKARNSIIEYLTQPKVKRWLRAIRGVEFIKVLIPQGHKQQPRSRCTSFSSF